MTSVPRLTLWPVTLQRRNGSLLSAVSPKAKVTFRAAAMLLITFFRTITLTDVRSSCDSHVGVGEDTELKRR